MPKTKRSKVVSLTKTARKTKEDKSTLIDSVRKSADEFPYIWLFSIGNMRNNYLKEVRDLWKGSRIYFGKNRVMARALGESREEEIKSGVSALAQVRKAMESIIILRASFTDFGRLFLRIPASLWFRRTPLHRFAPNRGRRLVRHPRAQGLR